MEGKGIELCTFIMTTIIFPNDYKSVRHRMCWKTTKELNWHTYDNNIIIIIIRLSARYKLKVMTIRFIISVVPVYKL